MGPVPRPPPRGSRLPNHLHPGSQAGPKGFTETDIRGQVPTAPRLC
jgi:hypothetical protein